MKPSVNTMRSSGGVIVRAPTMELDGEKSVGPSGCQKPRKLALGDTYMTTLRQATVRLADGRGRCVVATADIPAWQVVCEAHAYALAIHESWKERLCACCMDELTPAAAALKCCCELCGVTYYCSTACREIHATKGGVVGSVPHRQVCPALQAFSSLEQYGAEQMAKPRLLLEVLARRALASSAAEVRLAARFQSLDFHAAERLGQEEGEAWADCCETVRLCRAQLSAACGWRCLAMRGSGRCLPVL